MTARRWLIVGPGYDRVLYWAQEIGWVSDIAMATVFDDEDREYCPLPMLGEWLDVTKEMADGPANADE